MIRAPIVLSVFSYEAHIAINGLVAPNAVTRRDLVVHQNHWTTVSWPVNKNLRFGARLMVDAAQAFY